MYSLRFYEIESGYIMAVLKHIRNNAMETNFQATINKLLGDKKTRGLREFYKNKYDIYEYYLLIFNSDTWFKKLLGDFCEINSQRCLAKKQCESTIEDIMYLLHFSSLVDNDNIENYCRKYSL